LEKVVKFHFFLFVTEKSRRLESVPKAIKINRFVKKKGVAVLKFSYISDDFLPPVLRFAGKRSDIVSDITFRRQRNTTD